MIKKNRINISDLPRAADELQPEISDEELSNKVSELIAIAGELGWTVAVSSTRDAIVMGGVDIVDDILDGLCNDDFNVYERQPFHGTQKFML